MFCGKCGRSMSKNETECERCGEPNHAYVRPVVPIIEESPPWTRAKKLQIVGAALVVMWFVGLLFCVPLELTYVVPYFILLIPAIWLIFSKEDLGTMKTFYLDNRGCCKIGRKECDEGDCRTCKFIEKVNDEFPK
jgi:hypothetical protein